MTALARAGFGLLPSGEEMRQLNAIFGRRAENLRRYHEWAFTNGRDHVDGFQNNILTENKF
jgi:hypothetical protein